MVLVHFSLEILLSISSISVNPATITATITATIALCLLTVGTNGSITGGGREAYKA